MTSRGDWFSRLGWSTQQTPYERVSSLLLEMFVARYGMGRSDEIASIARDRVYGALADLREDIENMESDLRLHKEDRLRLRAEVMRLERELRESGKPTCVRMGLEDCGCRK